MTYFGPHNYEILDLCIAQDNGRFASCGGDKTIFIWDIKTGNTIRKFMGHFAQINCVAWNEDHSVLFSGSNDSTLRF